MIVNPYDQKARIVGEAYDYWRSRGDIKMADRMYGMWERLMEKGSEWENGMAQMRLEVLDAVAAYERRVGLR